MGAMNPETLLWSMVLDLGSVAADDAIVAGAYAYFPRKAKLTNALIVDGAGIAASDSNHVQIDLLNGANQVAEIDTRAAHENGLTVDVAKAMNIVAAAATIAAASTLTVKYEETGTVTMTSAKMLLFGYWLEQV